MIFINGLRVRVGNEFVNGAKVTLPPLSLNTVRVRTNDGEIPYRGINTRYETATLVPGTTDIYDVYKSGTDFWNLLCGSTNVIEVIEANTTNIKSTNSMFWGCSSLISVPLFDTTNVTGMHGMFCDCASLTSVPLFDTSNNEAMSQMFKGCISLTTVPQFDTSNVEDMEYMFSGCSSLSSVPLFNTPNVKWMRSMFYDCKSLTAIPLFDTSKVYYMNTMCYGCTNVQTGALALYNQASTQTTPPAEHSATFRDCGKDTQTGSAELRQIRWDWK